MNDSNNFASVAGNATAISDVTKKASFLIKYSSLPLTYKKLPISSHL
jgi:hypothetical protein